MMNYKEVSKVMVTVNTVTGPVSVEQIGRTLVHEHVAFQYPGWQFDAAAPPLDRQMAVSKAVEEIERAKACGVKTIIDCTPPDGSRDVDLIKEVAEKANINIVCATGRYNGAEGAPVYFTARHNFGKDIIPELYEGFVKEATEGIGNTKVRAGIIKVGTSLNQITAYEERVLRAAARACKETGVSIITHTEAGTMGLEQADIFISEGVNPKKVAIGHSCGTPDMKYLLSLLDKGVYVSFDRFGLDFIFPDAIRKAHLIALMGLGYTERLLVSQDYVINWPGRPLLTSEEQKRLAPEWNLTHLFRNIFPALKQAGIKDEQIDTLLIDNPRRWLEGK